ncbi:MAG TPA: tagaturonate epimerase family protein [bacterium]|nr:tagaturonate epimerase family protein [bacterium]
MNKAFSLQYPQFKVIANSVKKQGKDYFFMTEKDGEMYLAIGNRSFRIIQKKDAPSILKKTFSFLNPVPAGRKKSFGFGDRTGFATAGHIKAVKGTNFFPVFAQQSARELERTGRSFSNVVDDVVIWCFTEGWSEGFGADADHAKTIDILNNAIDSGYTYFTIDPSDRIKKPQHFSIKEIKNLNSYMKNYSGKTINIENFSIVFEDKTVAMLAFIYGDALDFIEECYRFIYDKTKRFDFEVSVDETGIPTDFQAHVFIAMELQKRKIDFNSLALRFPGRFEKGIDYIGDTEIFSKELMIHNKIRNYFGPYKLSLHSGSDKFSIYPIFNNIAGKMFHIKTSGTSWIEAIKTIAVVDRNLFVDCINEFIKQFAKNSVSYEISADISQIDVDTIKKESIDKLFSNKHLRQLIHISYGTLLGCDTNNILRNRFFETLRKNLPMYIQMVEQHLKNHIKLLS